MIKYCGFHLEGLIKGLPPKLHSHLSQLLVRNHIFDLCRTNMYILHVYTGGTNLMYMEHSYASGMHMGIHPANLSSYTPLFHSPLT